MKLHFTCFYAHIGKEKSWSRAFLVAVNSLFKVDSAKSFFFSGDFGLLSADTKVSRL